MSKVANIAPFEQELPSDFADRLGIFYTKQVSSTHKKEKGQFFTPTPIARLLASFSSLSKTTLRILDPGCGTAILSCALIEHLVDTSNEVKHIELVVYETDVDIIPFCDMVLKYLTKWLSIRKVRLDYQLQISDFILDNASVLRNHRTLDLFENSSDSKAIFDIVISNPPYFKLAKDDSRSLAAQELVSGQPNIYSIFMGIAAKLLVEDGELIFITPRSFASGNYFRAFREYFFNAVQLERIHLFNSRKDTFDRDSVLQETVVIQANKARINPSKKVLVCASAGIRDIFEPTVQYYECSELIDLNSKEKILHLPTTAKEESILNLASSWENILSDFNINISTGPVVSFRAVDFIQNIYESGTVFLAPLYWLHNVDKMSLEWPKQLKEKGQYIRIDGKSKSLLIPNKDYILLRRFSTKDDKSRLIAAPYFSSCTKVDYIGIENKLNYLYRKGGHLLEEEVVGLCALLNSEMFDTYFQIFNGNVNVSATELREMRFPPLRLILEIGNKIIQSKDYSMNNVNGIINELFELEIIMQ
jgi:adenine-specific DNA-methyltransferase